MASVNKVIIVGNLGQDPEVRQFQNGGSVTHISVATSERWTDKATGQPKEQTEWHRISLFNRLGEIAAQYLRKGSSVYIEGSLHTRKWTDQQGVERYATEIRANQMQMLGGNTSMPQDRGLSDGHQNPAAYQGGHFSPQGQNFNQQANFAQSQANWQTGNPTANQQAAYQNTPNTNFNQSTTTPNYQGHTNTNQFMNTPPAAQAPKVDKAITPPMGGVMDDDMPF